MKKLITILGVSLFLAGCAHQSLTLQTPKRSMPTYQERQNFIFYGVGQNKTIDAVKICKGEKNIAKVESYQTGGQVMASIGTALIYYPRTARVWCN